MNGSVRSRHGASRCWWAGWAVLLGGCAAAEPYVAPSEVRPATAKMTAQAPPPLPPGRRVSNLLDFETGNDLTFVAAQPQGQALIDSAIARGGAKCLVLSGGATALAVKTPVLLQGRPFPADWTLLGAYVLTDRPANLTISLVDAQRQSTLSRTTAITPGVWVPAMLDLTSLGGSTHADPGTLYFQFSAASPGTTIRLDDVMLVDNQEVLVDTSTTPPTTSTTTTTTTTPSTTSEGPSGWRVGRKGLNYIIDAPGRFGFALPTSQAQAAGWTAAEACEIRARFTSTAPPGSLTVYSDGRMYFGGEFRSASAGLKDAAQQMAQHSSPAELSVPESMGRLNRSTPGDADNDGYNESRGAYEVVARGDRIEMTLSPRSGTLSRPVLEIAGLPPGQPRVTVEGRLVPGAVRLSSSGDVLVEVPGQIVRPVLVNVHVQ